MFFGRYQLSRFALPQVSRHILFLFPVDFQTSVSLLALPLLAVTAAFAQSPDQLDPEPLSRAQALATAMQIENYRTPKRMAEAKPMVAVDSSNAVGAALADVE